MESRWLETFLAVARTGSLTAVAAELGLTQPGVSRHLQRLEQAVGVRLLDRTSRPARLTPAGERFRVYAESAVGQWRAIQRELQDEHTPLTGALRIAASSTPGELLVPELVAAFVARHPGVHPEVFIADSAIVAEEVREHRWDVGFVGVRFSGRDLEYRPVVEDEVVLAVPAGHPFAARGEVTLDEVVGQPFLAREGGSGTAASVTRLLTERGLAVPEHRTVMVLGSTQAIVSAVERGLGIGWVSSLALIDRNRERVVPIRVATLPLRRVLFLIRDPRRRLPPVAAAFVDGLGPLRPAPDTEG